ncbi:MAG TPA: crosslink repair DNA glycosylase YcaQ family protein [Gaiellaceae bacterium]|nr:crosslink repair DNA glycosylase YcaQ family protein [Gaiellaceae bacterium]
MVVDRGRVVGVWVHKKRGARVEIAMEPFAPLSATTARAVDRELDSLAAFLGAER